jgi:hypothetical protein
MKKAIFGVFLALGLFLSSCGVESAVTDTELTAQGAPTAAYLFCDTRADFYFNLTTYCKDGFTLYVQSWERPTVYNCGNWYEILFYRSNYWGTYPHRMKVTAFGWQLNYRIMDFSPCVYW